MAAYNQWMNERLYNVCDSISDSERKQDLGAFFGSIHNTLNHIMLGDLAFMSRFSGTPETVPELAVNLYDDFTQLRHAREALDNRITDWSATVTDDWLRQQLTYKSKVDGGDITAPHWVLLTHMFNHETHHRGQITTLLNQLGHDMGTTDIPFMDRYRPA
ncbi:damage-inducible protein DinB [Chromatiales bacterium (ex Bugula neritina AB1)]|nr:damage-inducible protein DinB [Chromatiales bacterium (ex Bugula neritina AB1)]